jgi:hypothetical protein
MSCTAFFGIVDLHHGPGGDALLASRYNFLPEMLAFS